MAGTAENILAPWANTSWGRSFLHPDQAYRKYGDAAEQGWQQAQGYEKPYWQNGMDQTGKLNGAEDQLLNPEQLQAKWASGYQMSPYAQQSMQNAKSSGLDAASSMGLMGSSAALSNIQSGSSNIMNADRQQYMDDMMKKYMAGIGIGTDMYGTGAQMGSTMGGQAMTAGGNRGQAAYGAAAAPGEQFKSMMNMAMKAAMGGYGPASGGK